MYIGTLCEVCLQERLFDSARNFIKKKADDVSDKVGFMKRRLIDKIEDRASGGRMQTERTLRKVDPKDVPDWAKKQAGIS